MPFNIVDTLNGTADDILGSKFLYNIADSPIYTAIVITIIVVLISTICTKFTSGGSFTMTARIVFWTFTVVTILMLLHDRIILRHAENTQRSGNYEDYLDVVPVGVTDTNEAAPPGVIPVHIGRY